MRHNVVTFRMCISSYCCNVSVLLLLYSFIQNLFHIQNINQSSAYDLISRHAVFSNAQWSVGLNKSCSVAQVSLQICKPCFKFLKELVNAKC